jgi:cell division protein FtsW (lipid II flippase)
MVFCPSTSEFAKFGTFVALAKVMSHDFSLENRSQDIAYRSLVIRAINCFTDDTGTHCLVAFLSILSEGMSGLILFFLFSLHYFLLSIVACSLLFVVLLILSALRCLFYAKKME